MQENKLNAKKANLSTDRLLSLVEFMARQQEAVRLTDIAAGCGMNISTVHRFLASLLAGGYAVKTEEGMYRLTFAFCRLGESIRRNTDMRSLCLPILRTIAQNTGCAAKLVKEYDMDAICLESVQGDLIGGFLPEYGVQPLHTSAAGKLIISHWQPRRLEELVQIKGLKAMTPAAITQLTSLRRELYMVRSRGYAFDEEETELGWHSLAVPLRDYTNEVIAAIELRVPTSVLSQDELMRHYPMLVNAGDQLSRFLGYDSTMDRPPTFRR